MNDCKEISELLVDYVNRNLTQEENIKVVLHLSQCKECLKEAAEIIEIRDMLGTQLKEVPDAVKKAAFDKVIANDSSISKILNSKSPFMALDLVEYSLDKLGYVINFAINEV